MVCSAEVWAGRGPSPARRRREQENYPPTPLHASSSSSSQTETPEGGFSGAGGGGGGGGGWRRPLPSSASINVRLLDAAVQVFAASFGQQVRLLFFLFFFAGFAVVVLPCFCGRMVGSLPLVVHPCFGQ